MRIQSGKYAGKASEAIVLKCPDYVQWTLESGPPQSKLRAEFQRLVQIFDRKSLEKECHHCHGPATRASMYDGNYDFMFWCDDCNEYGSGANRGKLRIVTKYMEALRHIDLTASGRKEWKLNAIRELARSKGLSKRVTEKEAVDFFAG